MFYFRVARSHKIPCQLIGWVWPFKLCAPQFLSLWTSEVTNFLLALAPFIFKFSQRSTSYGTLSNLYVINICKNMQNFLLKKSFFNHFRYFPRLRKEIFTRIRRKFRQNKKLQVLLGSADFFIRKQCCQIWSFQTKLVFWDFIWSAKFAFGLWSLFGLFRTLRLVLWSFLVFFGNFLMIWSFK